MGQTTSSKRAIHSNYTINESIIEQEIKILKLWSGLKECSIIFDSNLQGDGKEALMKTVLNKKNLYFIHHDVFGNIFGGFISTTINVTNQPISDSNAFVFSLFRKGVVKNNRYLMLNNDPPHAFRLNSDVTNDELYAFGDANTVEDLVVSKMNKFSFTSPFSCSFQFNDETSPFVDLYFPYYISINRIVVIEMN